MDGILNKLADSVSAARDLEGLTRPLLELLEAVTGMESTYLTSIDLEAGEQHIDIVRNGKAMQIPEGLTVPWADTLCKRAIDEGKYNTSEVDRCWGDNEGAKALGIKTFLSQPVRTLDGNLYGTLCAASGDRVQIPEGTVRVLGMFAELIAHQVERERTLQNLKRDNQELSSQAFVDPLTGVANRRALLNELRRMLARAQRDAGSVHIAFIDLDGFKGINDRHGHKIGDQFLKQVAGRLSSSVRLGDFVARYGGDEFVVVTESRRDEDLSQRLQAQIAGHYSGESLQIDYAGASIGVIRSLPGETDAETLLARADAAMYEVKRLRKAQRGV